MLGSSGHPWGPICTAPAHESAANISLAKEGKGALNSLLTSLFLTVMWEHFKMVLGERFPNPDPPEGCDPIFVGLWNGLCNSNLRRNRQGRKPVLYPTQVLGLLLRYQREGEARATRYLYRNPNRSTQRFSRLQESRVWIWYNCLLLPSWLALHPRTIYNLACNSLLPYICFYSSLQWVSHHLS